MTRLAPGIYQEQGKHYVVEDELADSLGFTRDELLACRLDLVIGIAFAERGIDPDRVERVRTAAHLKGRR